MISVPWADFKSFITSRSLIPSYIVANNMYMIRAQDGWFGLSCDISMDGSAADDQADFEANFRSLANAKIGNPVTSVPDPAPFAQPLYRTKRNAASDLVTIAPGGVGDINYQITQELYVSGGAIVVENAEIGDYIVAQVKDVDGVIPAPYRAALCEAWPVAAEYITKQYVMVGVPGTITPGSISNTEIDTYPLNAKISAGLYLYMGYHAVATGLTRRIGVNYHLTKKL